MLCIERERIADMFTDDAREPYISSVHEKVHHNNLTINNPDLKPLVYLTGQALAGLLANPTVWELAIESDNPASYIGRLAVAQGAIVAKLLEKKEDKTKV
jgi:hypothetical protein